MKSNNQKQVAAFDQVLGHCNDLGQKYNPGNDSIKVAALKSLLTSAQEKVNAAHNAKIQLMEVVNTRQAAFAKLPGIATRILNGLISSDASPEQIQDVKAYRDRLRSRKAKNTKAEETSDATKPAGETDSSKNTFRGPVSYLDFESKLNTFRSIIALAAMEPNYKPNEPEFSIASLNNIVHELEEKSKAVNQAQVAFRIARKECKAALYGDSGLRGVTKRVKKYVLFAFGATSDQFKTINSIKLNSR
jgi:hypothetical protein